MSPAFSVFPTTLTYARRTIDESPRQSVSLDSVWQHMGVLFASPRYDIQTAIRGAFIPYVLSHLRLQTCLLILRTGHVELVYEASPTVKFRANSQSGFLCIYAHLKAWSRDIPHRILDCQIINRPHIRQESLRVTHSQPIWRCGSSAVSQYTRQFGATQDDVRETGLLSALDRRIPAKGHTERHSVLIRRCPAQARLHLVSSAVFTVLSPS